jgi:hypothetical protein
MTRYARQSSRWSPGLIFLLAAGFGGVVSTHPGGAALAQAQQPATPAQAPAAAQDDQLDQAQLEALLAPIALYPDSLLMQVLMASTYPLEVVQAKRWLGEGTNAQLKGEALSSALNDQPWDPSVKSLVPFPDVLTMMNDQLDWTQQVGDAVLGQQQDVMNSVQALRGRAQANGSLQSGPQQTVSVTNNVVVPPPADAPPPTVPAPQQVISIAPTQPEQVYVPAYNPSVVYGSWPYPQYPPTYYPPPPAWGVGNALLTGMAFAGGVAVVGSLFGWASPSWGRGDVDVNVNRYNNINANRNQISNNRWRHDESHRHGVAYRNDEVRNRYRESGGGANARDRAQSREQFRGRAQQVERGGGIDAAARAGDRGGPGDRDGFGNRGPGAGDRVGQPDRRPEGNRPNVADRQGAGGAGNRQVGQQAQHRPSGRPQTTQAAARQGPQALQGVGHGGHERAAAQRGHASRQGQPAARAQAQHRAAPHGGGHRGGGHHGRR